MTRITFWEPSGEVTVPGKGTFRDQYASGAFDGVIGQRVRFRSRPGDPQIGWTTVIEVVVDDDGLGATWTVDTDLDETLFRARQGGMSFSFRPEPEIRFRDPLAAQPLVIRRQGGEGA